MRAQERADRGEIRPQMHPAGLDDDLRVALEEVRAGRWRPMRDLLAASGTDWELRTSRSQVLGTAAARSHVVRVWLVEEPYSADAVMMRARVAVERALHAHRSGHDSAQDFAREARKAALAAAERLERDPVPWVCLLALALLDGDQLLDEHRWRAPEPMLPAGPWRLMHRVYQRDRFNREAHHRMLQVLLHARTGGSAAALQFVHWVGSWVPRDSGSSLLVLPLYAYAEHYRARREQGAYDAVAHWQWRGEPVVLDVRRAYQGWFQQSHPVRRSVLDLNYLAHALWAGRQYEQAARVFAELGPHAARQPWGYVSDDPHDPAAVAAGFTHARAQSLAVAGSPPPRADPRR
ncbi:MULTISPECIES: hypothetical protein [unclassified Streptomyces]|uniref:hypothetical protein n=1 Tax=unclassified Streptomyces TaxID=2593676 RepID=UPI001EF3B3EA|nr:MULTISPECIES: hypothetical protein [unclassified Streptomyces]